MSIFPIALVSSVSIALGGMIALALSARAKALAAFAAATMLAIAFVDLLPEALAMNPHALAVPMIFLGFAAGWLLCRIVCQSVSHGWTAPGWMFGHAIIDGLMIGLGFSVSLQVGLVLTLAIIAHGLTHGINTFHLSKPAQRSRWLLANMVAPLIGFFLSRFISLPVEVLSVLIAGLAGGFTYFALRDWREIVGNRRLDVRLATIIGVALIVIIRLILP